MPDSFGNNQGNRQGLYTEITAVLSTSVDNYVDKCRREVSICG